MKQIILLVPDTIDHVIGSSRSRKVKSEDVTHDNLKRALCDRSNYHQYYYFQASDRVKVVSIVDYEEGMEHRVKKRCER
jgi:predicted nucleotidyltransferase